MVSPMSSKLVQLVVLVLAALFEVGGDALIRAGLRGKGLLMIAIGFCGAYTTFSSYAFESIVYFQQGNWTLFAGNILANNLLCLGAILGGAALARAL